MASLRVAFLGPAASFSHQAVLETFGRSVQLHPRPAFADIFSAVQNDAVDYAVVPFENSTNGSVVQTLDLLADRQGLYPDITVCGEHFLTVHHCLMRGKTDTSTGSGPERYKTITKLYTHPQAWGQCEAFLQKHFKGVERQDVSSTSKAAELVAADTTGQSAAIASKLAGEYHGAEILEENIEDQADNTTRFLILRNLRSSHSADITRYLPPKEEEAEKRRKTLISFMIEHSAPGALADALVVFKKHGLNLTSINSRPSLIRPWQYIFFVECTPVTGTSDPESIPAFMEELKTISKSCRNLGTWRDELPS
ncbi:hypothetical protein VTN49DRAFT_1487 [Thermomyces lanuginosus]|uniref:uncharacterized protein n=1 Tax=Thermomyces lanuginosus TaxID=5541 RepID=UPI0037440648